MMQMTKTSQQWWIYIKWKVGFETKIFPSYDICDFELTIVKYYKNSINAALY